MSQFSDFLRVKSGLLILVRVKDLTFSNSVLWKSLHTGWEASYLSSDVFKFESQRNLVSQPPPPESSLWFRRLSLAELSLVELLGGTPLVWIVQALVQAGPPHGLGQVRGGRRINSPAPKRILHMSWARDLEQKLRNKRIHQLTCAPHEFSKWGLCLGWYYFNISFSYVKRFVTRLCGKTYIFLLVAPNQTICEHGRISEKYNALESDCEMWKHVLWTFLC